MEQGFSCLLVSKYTQYCEQTRSELATRWRAARADRPAQSHMPLVLVMGALHALIVAPPSTLPTRCARAGSTLLAEEALLTLAEVEAAAARVGCELVVKATGPAYRIELLWEAGKTLPSPPVQTLGYNDDAPPPPELLGYSDGFTQPTGVTHLETIEVRRYTGFWARRREAGARRYAATRRLAPGLLVSLASACWIREKGPFGNERAQLLCIRDDERQHRSLVRYYRRIGFKTIREVGSDLRSVADRVVWGGEGTLMELDIDAMRRAFAPQVRKMGLQGS
jgi:hypothetical protein